MRKYTRTDDTAKVVSPQAHQAIDAELTKLGKTSARGLTSQERSSLEKTVDESDITC